MHYISVGQKLVMLIIHSTSGTFLSLHNLEAAHEEAMQLRRVLQNLEKPGSNRVNPLATPCSWRGGGGSPPYPLGPMALH